MVRQIEGLSIMENVFILAVMLTRRESVETCMAGSMEPDFGVK
jgi:hypothetical protein